MGRAIDSARQTTGVQVIVVDGGSTDQTVDVALTHGAEVVVSPPGRGIQMNAGAQAAHAAWLLFLHADTRLPFGYDRHVRSVLSSPHSSAGAFRMAFDRSSISLRLIEWGTYLRARYWHMPYGDQALFLRRETFDNAGRYPAVSAMEDYLLVLRLRRMGQVAVGSLPVLTSARTYLHHGPWHTVLLHQRMILTWVWRQWRTRRK